MPFGLLHNRSTHCQSSNGWSHEEETAIFSKFKDVSVVTETKSCIYQCVIRNERGWPLFEVRFEDEADGAARRGCGWGEDASTGGATKGLSWTPSLDGYEQNVERHLTQPGWEIRWSCYYSFFWYRYYFSKKNAVPKSVTHIGETQENLERSIAISILTNGACKDLNLLHSVSKSPILSFASLQINYLATG